MELTDSELVAQALAGTQSAYHELVCRYSRPALNLVFRLVQNRGIAEELTQDAFVRAFARLASYDATRKFSSWFLQVAHNVAIDYLRQRKLDAISLDAVGGAGRGISDTGTRSPHDQAEHSELSAALAEGLATVRPEYRAALVLHYQHGLGHAELSEILGIPIGTVKTYLHRGRKELAVFLTARGWHRETLPALNP